MKEIEIENYHNVIREMITKENEIRNQRTHWFLVIQGFLVAGCCTLYKELVQCTGESGEQLSATILMCSILGFVSAVVTLFAAWRSVKSIDMAMACWNRFLTQANKDADDYPPVALITYQIIKTPQNDREMDLHAKMYKEKFCCRECLDKLLNKCDIILPFRSLPFIFGAIWAIVFVYIGTNFTCIS